MKRLYDMAKPPISSRFASGPPSSRKLPSWLGRLLPHELAGELEHLEKRSETEMLYS